MAGKRYHEPTQVGLTSSTSADVSAGARGLSANAPFARLQLGRYFGRVSEPEFVVRVADLDRGPKTVKWNLSKRWLARALKPSEARADSDGLAELEIRKSGREVMVRGRARATVTMTCSRSLEPVQVELEPEIFLLLSQAKEPDHKRPHRHRSSRAQRERTGRSTKRAWADDPELSDEEAARDMFAGETLVLDGFIREFILLELPMNPIRSDLRATTEQATAPRPVPTERTDPRLAPLAALLDRMRNKSAGKE